jgi:transcriptional regulator with XRE-family HTH domain
MGKVARAYREHPYHWPVYGEGGIPQRLLGEWVGLSQGQVSRIENGPPIRNLDTLAYWARVLRIPPDLLWFKLPEQSASRSTFGQHEETTEDTVQAASEIDDLGNLELTSLVSVLAADRLPLLDSRSEGGRVGVGALGGMSLPETAELLLKLFLQLDDELGGDVLYLPLARYVGRLAVNVQEGASDDLAAFGQLAQMTGWLALDANHHGAARRYLTTAVYVAHEADEPALAASSLAYMSLQEAYRARPTPALSLAQTALTVGNGRLTPLTKTMLGTRLARAQAGLRQRAECLHTLDQVQAAFSNAGQREEPVWIFYVDEIEVAAQKGACYLDLGMTAEASAALTRALDLLKTQAPHRVRDRVHYISRLAKCYLLDGEVEQACEIAAEGLVLNDAIGSARMVERLREFSDALEPFSGNEAARDFRQLFATSIAFASSQVIPEGPA